MFLQFLSDLDPDLAASLREQLRVRWTHSSTALEGNTLTEGETLGVLQYGLTISGRPLAHHNEVVGHSRALDLLFQVGQSGRDMTEADLFALHTAVQTAVEVDYLKPVGAWKVEANSTLAKLGGKTVINDNYAAPHDVPALMNEWLGQFNKARKGGTAPLEDFVRAHASFARIHPFADGNGRMARLLANLPVLEKGRLPILIPATERLRYVEALATWQVACGPPRPGHDLSSHPEALLDFHALCEKSMAVTHQMLAEAQALQAARHT